MSSSVPRAVVEAFYHALSIRDMGTLATFFDDQVTWTISEIGIACDGSRVTATRIRFSPAISTSVGSYSIQPAPGR
jgi:hypothetical protein